MMTDEGFWWRGGDGVEVIRRIFSGEVAYFPANVVTTPSVRKKLVWVEHETLMVGDEGSIRMKEYVDPKRLRPSPPLEISPSFEVGDDVDVFNVTEGCWIRGNVKAVFGNSRYVVGFQGVNSQETEVENDFNNLRLHREWVDGTWVPSLSQHGNVLESTSKSIIKLKKKSRKRDEYDEEEANKGSWIDPYKEECYKPPWKKLESCERKTTEKKVFNRGTMVEVRSDERGYEGSWYSAKIISYLGKDRYTVEYQTLRTEDYRELLKEEVRGSDLRPKPPQLVQKAKRYELYEDVDAWFNDGWWSGQVYKINNSYTRYGVYFETTNERLEFAYNDLRPCQVWSKGKWSRA